MYTFRVYLLNPSHADYDSHVNKILICSMVVGFIEYK